MPGFILHHRHHSAECGIAFAAWRGFDSPLRHHRTVGTCSLGGHELWWLVDASTPDGALDHTSGHAYLWDLRPERLLRQACRSAADG